MKNKEKLEKINMLEQELKLVLAYLSEAKDDIKARDAELYTDRPWGAVKRRCQSLRDVLLNFYK